MIKNFNEMLPEILNTIHGSTFVFYPTGSRFFGGNVAAEADWDFFVEDSTDVRLFLELHGFVSNDMECYDDCNSAAVYTYHGDYSSDKGLGKIDVQLIPANRMGSKMLVQKILREKYGSIGIPGDKAARREIWHLMFHALRALNLAV